MSHPQHISHSGSEKSAHLLVVQIDFTSNNCEYCYLSPRLKMFVSMREVILALSDIERPGVYLQEIMPVEFRVSVGKSP